MIQRIQSVYLLIAAILMAVVVCSPLTLLSAHDVLYMFKGAGVFDEASALVYSPWGIVACEVASALLSFVTIFLFKKRKAQIKLCYVLIILDLVFYAVFAFYLHTAQSVLGAEFERVAYGLALPAVSLVLTVLALSKIKADERLVQSLNRIR